MLASCEILWVTPLFTTMEAALCRLAPLDQQIGAPWPHQMRQFLQEAIQILEETRVKRLDSEHYPTSNGNDIEAKRNEASILRHFLYRSETNKLILKL